MSNGAKNVKHEIAPETWPSAEAASASRLFSPCAIGAATARSRTWVPAMVPWRASDDGFATDDVIAWYRRFAEGKPGVLVVEATGIRDVPSGPLLRIGDDRFVPGLKRLVAAVREASEGQTLLFVQIIDFLAIRRRPEPATYFQRYLKIDEALRERLRAATGDDSLARASDTEVRGALLATPREWIERVLEARQLEALDHGHRERVTDVDLPHVAELPRVLPPLFAAAARRANAAGFDGVELHYAHAYTMASFLSRRNDRRDGYGGSVDARARLPLEVFSATRAAVPEDFVVGCRMLGDEVIDGGSRIDDACAYAAAFARAGFDFLSISKGGKFEDAKQPRVGHAAYPYTGTSGHECMPTVRIDERGPFGRNVPLAAAIRAAVRQAGCATPVVAAGGINSFSLAEQILQDGGADFVAAARQSLADPDWFEKIRRGRGAEIRRCIYTNYCEALDQQHKQVTCQLWDREFDPADESIRKSPDGRRRLLPP
jgi:2,4-dienoyl-CoA reductase-like NADH-dependent reductase (Old Yellow Enzyme family)